MATKSYKCPSCGAGIHFKPALQKFKCDFCLSEYTEEEIERINKDRGGTLIIEEGKGEKSQDKNQGGNQELVSYECNSCGAKVVTDDTTTATFCYYCHNPVIISSRLKGDFQPNKMIPFTIDKENAQNKFLAWAKKRRFVPDDFYSKSQLEKISGIYLPYWWANCEVDIDYIGEGRNIRVWRVGDKEYTETKKYEIVRRGKADINNVGELAFTKIDEKLLDGIAPYTENEAKEFSMPYLSGFLAEQYNRTVDDIKPKVKERLDRYSKSIIDESITGFSLVNQKVNNSRIKYKDWNYTLLPAWILTYIYKGKTYVFAINGQTGKSFGELPFNKGKALKVSGGIFAVTSIALLLGGWLIW